MGSSGRPEKLLELKVTISILLGDTEINNTL